MDRRKHRFFALVSGDFPCRNERARRGGSPRIGISMLAAAACLLAIFARQGELGAAEAKRHAEFVATRQCDRCGFGTIRLQTPQTHRSVSVGFLTDEELARISALLRVAKRKAPDPRGDAIDYARPPHAWSGAGSENASLGEGIEPGFVSAAAIAIVEALTKGGDLTEPGASLTLGPSSLQVLNIDDGGWFSLRLNTPQFAYQTIYSP